MFNLGDLALLQDVAIHADIEDTAQTISFPEIRTTAVGDNGTKRVLAGSSVTVTDTVAYTNLMPGLTYTMRGEIHLRNADGSDSGVLEVDGAAVTSEVTFTPAEANGTIEMAFSFDATGLGGSSLVVFEHCYETSADGSEELVAEHADISDQGQTVGIERLPHTGDLTVLDSIAALAACGAILMTTGATIAKRRKETPM